MPFAGTMQTSTETSTLTIADNSSLSSAIDLGGRGLTAIIIPSTWVTATVITFQVSVDDSTYYNLYHDVSATLTEYSVPVAASRYITLDQEKFFGIKYLKVRSGTAGSAVNQTEDNGVVLTLVAFAI